MIIDLFKPLTYLYHEFFTLKSLIDKCISYQGSRRTVNFLFKSYLIETALLYLSPKPTPPTFMAFISEEPYLEMVSTGLFSVLGFLLESEAAEIV